MLLGINTAAETAFLYLYDETGKMIAEKSWGAGRELARGLLRQIDNFLSEQGRTVKNLTGLFVFKGPGSFTGLRIGLTVMNTVAFSEQIPIVGVSGEDWRDSATARLKNGGNDQVVLPEYGAEARITKPKK